MSKGYTQEFDELCTPLYESYRAQLELVLGKTLEVRLEPNWAKPQKIGTMDYMRLDKIVSEFKMDQTVSIRGAQIVSEHGVIILHQHFSIPLNMRKGDSAIVTVNAEWPWS